MPNICIKQACVYLFYCESIYFKASVNMFEHTEIEESIYEGDVEPSYKKLLGEYQPWRSQKEN